MSAVTWYELIGYAASALIVLSLMMQSLLRLRIVNLVGATVFTVYGLLIAAPPVWAVNAAIVVIDLWYLWRMLRSTEDLEVLRVAPDSAYLRRFLAYHEYEITRFVPTFSGVRPDHGAFFVLRDLVPAALVLVRIEGHEAVVDLDYAIPAYRDYTSGEFVYGGELFAEFAVRRVVAPSGNPEYDRYLRRMGFRRTGDQWELPVSN
jgi:hypothetical protein